MRGMSAAAVRAGARSGSRQPATTMFGRNLFIGNGSAPFSMSRAFRPSKEDI
jgi:hypothetical protein